MKKTVIDGYIFCLSTVKGTDISESEQAAIETAIKNRPIPPEGFDYRLRDSDLTWELCEYTASDETETMTETEEKAMAYDILTGVIA